MATCVPEVPWPRVVLSLTLFALGFLLDDVMTGVALYRGRALMQNYTAHPPLPDLGFDLVPYVPALCDHSIIESAFLIALMLYTLFRRMVFYRGGWLVLCRFAVCDALLMALRATTVATTSLNNPWPFCNACGIADGCPETLWGAVVYTVQRFPTYDCGDTIFSHASASAHPAPPRLPLHSSPPWLVSPLLWLNLIYILRSLTVRSGHTVHFLLMGLIWATYPAESSSAWSVRAEVAAVWGAVVAGITLLISCRFHYSIDVLIAIYLTLPVWYSWDYLSIFDAGLLSRPVQWFQAPLTAHKTSL